MINNVVRLNFSRPKKVAAPAMAVPFVLTSDGGQWTLDGGDRLMTPSQVSEIADALREVARKLKEAASISAGAQAANCLGEFVLFENGGVDYWMPPDAISPQNRTILRQSLKKTLNSISER